MRNIIFNKVSSKLWLLALLSGGTLFNYSILASIDPKTARAGDLEFDAGSYTTPPSGPTLSGGAATLRENTTDSAPAISGGLFATYTPTVTMSIAISNPQYTNGLTIGSAGAGTNKTLTPVAVFGKMNQYGVGGTTTAATNAYFTSTPNSTTGTGISTTDNYAFLMFASTEPLFNATPAIAKNTRNYYADLTITFNIPVSNPVIQMTGMGGTTQGGHGHSAEFELQDTAITGITASKLSGSPYLSVTSAGVITNNAAAITATCSTGAACGSVQFTGTNITTLKFKVYVRGDNGGTGGWSQTGNVNTTANANNGDAFLFGGASVALPVTVSGKVSDDANGLVDSLVNGTGTNAGGLSANLVDGNNKVVATSLVAANGTYSFLAIGAGAYTVSLSTIPGVQGTTAPAISLPTNWVNTGEGTVAAGDGTIDGKTAITVGTAAVSNVNFGIEQLPNTTDLTPSSQLNPGGTNTVTVPTLTGVDPEDGTFSTGKSFKIIALPTNGTLYYLNASNVPVAVTAGQVINNYDPTKLKLDPTSNGDTTVTFTYAAVDAAGKEDLTPATVSMSFTAPVASVISIFGTVWNDIDGSGNSGFNLITTPSGESVTNAGGGLYAILIDGSPTKKVIGSALVAADGTYSFTGVATNQTGLTIELSTTPGTLNSTTIPTPGVPTGWKSTANTPLTGPTKQPITAPFATALIDITGKDFGVAKPANVVLVKRITGIKRPTDTAWNRTKNPHEPALTATRLDTVVPNTADSANNGNYDNPNWPATYVIGAPNAGLVLPGDELEYTIYYLNTQGANAKSLKICDPIKGKQTYTLGSMQLFPNSTSTAIALTDSDTDTATDQAAFYASAASLTNCNATSSTAIGADQGGVSIQLVGKNGTFNPTAIPGATGIATPLNSYGFFRFTTKVKP